MPKYKTLLSHRIISVIGLGNPEPMYQNTRHNVAATVMKTMWSQLATLKETQAWTPHKLIARTRAEPKTRQFKRHISKFFDEKVITHKKPATKPRYILNLNLKHAYHEGIKMLLVTPTIDLNNEYDGPPLKLYDYDFAKRFDLYRKTFCFGYIDNTFMNKNGAVVSKFFSEQHAFFKEQLKDVKYYKDAAPATKYTFSNYIMADDVDTPIGKIKISDKHSSDRGHNGVRDCTKYMGANDDMMYVKIFVGISLSKWNNDVFSKLLLRDFVLGEFTPEEMDYLKENTVPMIWYELHKMETIVAAK